MAWLLTLWLVPWSLWLFTPPVAPAPTLRFHHLHYRAADPLTAMRQLAGPATQPSILQGLGAGVRISQESRPPEYVLFDRQSLPAAVQPAPPASALPRLIQWLAARGFAVEADQATVRTLSERLAQEDVAFEHIAFAASDFPGALNRLRAAHVTLSRTTGESTFVDAGLGTPFEIVRDPDQPDLFWCAMHPDVRSSSAGTCPICRMALVPIPPPQAGEYHMDVDVLPSRAGSGASGLRVTLGDLSRRRPSLLTVHDKRLHLFVIGEDLTYFQHVHPTQLADGRFEWTQAIPAGEYMVVADFMPAGGTPQMLQRAVVTRGYNWTPNAASAAAALRPSSVASTGGVRAALVLPALVVGQTATVRVSLTNEVTGRPVADLEPYLSAPGHALMASADLTHVVHVHPDEQETFGPTLSFQILPAVDGPYKLWVQVQRRGRVMTFPFVVAVGK